MRVHTGPPAAASARTLQARAYTVGEHVVLGGGESLDSDEGRLLTHELSHVVQQRRSPRSPREAINRPGDPSEHEADAVAAGLKAPSTLGVGATSVARIQRQQQSARGTAAAAPHLDVRPSRNGAPCACLVFIHNNERNARLTAQLMHHHCSYNLAIIEPDDRQRRIRLPGHRNTVDPNELFPRQVTEECLDDPQPCEDYLNANAGSTDRATVEGYAQRQFFLAIRECSNAFALPVVALHNNTITDTARYRRRPASADPSDLRRGTFEQAPAEQGPDTETDDNGARPIQELRDWLDENLDQATTDQLTGRAGTTNIFRWCVSPDTSRCHVGDPDNPDTVVWTTNEADFERLSREDVNVVLQSAAATGGESATDLSTLFLVAQELIAGRLGAVLTALENDAAVEVARIREILGLTQGLDEQGDRSPRDPVGALLDILRGVARLLALLLRWALVAGERLVRLRRLRYINVETPGSPTRAGQTREQLRDESYTSIIAVLRAAGLHCCGNDNATAEARIREGLRRGTLEEDAD